MPQLTIFISYSHQDENDKNELMTHLEVLQRQGLIEAWTDDQIGVGEEWAREIEEGISRAKIAILLITKNYLSSEFILQGQVQQLLERHKQKGLIIFPVIARPCAWGKVPWLAQMRVRPKHKKPVWRDSGRYTDKELAVIAEEIADIMAKVAPTTTPPVSPGPEQVSQPATPKRKPASSGIGEAGVGAKLPPQEIAPINEALTRRNLTLFIGADLPQGITGLPARIDLAHDLARRKGLDETLSLAEVTQRVSQAGSRWEFTDFIRNALDTTGKEPQPVHKAIAALVKQYQLETIITTAYHNLLELAFQQAGIGFNRVVRGSEVNFTRPDRPTLLKLYGDIQQPDTLVVTDRDHSDLLRDRAKEALIEEVRRTFRRSTVLLLGYNLADPDFRFLFDQIAESRFARLAYAVWSGLPEADVRMWRDRGIVILETDPFGLLDGTVAPVQPVREREISNAASTVKIEPISVNKLASQPQEDRVDFAFITALEKEARAVVSRLENRKIRRFEDKDIRTYHYGTIPIQDTNQFYRAVVVLLPNMGNIPATIAVTDTIIRWNPRFVLMVGIAGGIPQDKLELGDVIVADQIVGYEYGKITDKGLKPRDRVYPASALLLDRVRNFWDDDWANQINIHRPENASRAVSRLFIGPIASGNKVVASTEFRQQLLLHWPKLIGLEMEGEGVFAATFDRPRIPATLVIRGVCDMADERKSDEWQEYAANAAAAFAISFIKSCPVDPQL